MKAFKLLWIGLILLVISNTTFAQDPHFSQYFASPLTLNPATTGVFSGNYRFTGIFRSQWHSVLKDNPLDQAGVASFRTFSGSFDLRTNAGFSKYDAVGVGVVFLSDVAGAARFGSNSVSASFAYMKGLNRQNNHYISLGVQAGVTQRSIDYTNLRFGSQFDGENYNPVLGSGEVFADDNFMFADVSAGLFWYYVANKRTNFYAGYSAYHINTPDQSFYGTDDVRLFLKHAFHGGLEVGIGNSQANLLPSLLFMTQGPAYESNIGSYVKFFFDSRDPLGNAFYIGPFYRIVGGEVGAINSEALIAATKVDISSVTLGFSYDFNISELTRASNAWGGFEISVAHIGDFGKKGPKTIYCPRF